MAIVNNRSFRQPNKEYKPSIMTIQTSLNSRFVENESCECRVKGNFFKSNLKPFLDHVPSRVH
jgi:hypothetical protein